MEEENKDKKIEEEKPQVLEDKESSVEDKGGVGFPLDHEHNGNDFTQIKIQNIAGYIQIVSAVPTHVPTSIYNQVVVYVSGTTEILYVYDKSTSTWVSIGDDLSELGIFGDGSDGDLAISSGTTTLTKDTYYDDLTITGTAILNPAGYRVFVSGTLTIGTSGGSDTCKIIRTGNVGTAGTNAGGSAGLGGAGGAALSGVTLPNGNAGTAGSDGGTSPNNANDEAGTAGVAGGAGADQNPSIGGTGSTSQAGGAGGAWAGFGGGAGGAGAAGGVVTLPPNEPSALFDMVNLWNPKTFTLHKSSSAPGGAGGGGGGGHQINADAGDGGGGGGSGSDGGFIAVYAKTIVNHVAGGIQSKGGAGGNGGNGGNASTSLGSSAGGGGGGAGGNGGSGGVVILVYKTKSGSGTFTVSGGAGGTGGALGNPVGTNTTPAVAGTNGSTGGTGLVWELDI